jgi:hypothetical protein
VNGWRLRGTPARSAPGHLVAGEAQGQPAYERWVRRPGQDLAALVDESFADLAGLAG